MKMTSEPTKFSAPYVGIRAYSFDETEIFTGRDADIGYVADLVADKESWRVILLHGMSGSGKSSFLKAGLIPEITSAVDTSVFRRSSGDANWTFITSTADPLRRLAEVAVELVNTHAGDRINLTWDTLGLEHATAEEKTNALACGPDLLASLLDQLAPLLPRPLLLIVDQAEEIFTLRVDQQADQARDLFFEFLACFCSKPSWVQILISMRTEFYGRFDAELRRRLGPQMPVAPYFLRPLSVSVLEHVVLAPCEHTFISEKGNLYKILFDSGLAKRIAKDVADSFPGPGALTCLQIVCVRLCEQAVTTAGVTDAPGSVYVAQITAQMYESMGALPLVIEDVIDLAIANFCNERELSVADSMGYWETCKSLLSDLVKQNSEGTPVTTFVLREKFVESLFSKLTRYFPRETSFAYSLLARGVFNSIPPSELAAPDPVAIRESINELLNYMSRPEVRVIRYIEIVEAGHQNPKSYIALGHDVLAVGLVEAAARRKFTEQRREKARKGFVVRVSLVSVAVTVLMFILSFFVTNLGNARGSSLGSYSLFFWISLCLGWYASMLLEIFIAIMNDNVLHTIRRYHDGMAPDLLISGNFWIHISWPFAFKKYFAKRSSIQLVFRKVREVERIEFVSAGVTAFPGGARF